MFSSIKEKFQTLLRDLFQFDCADLDFGIYRIMNHKRAVIERFIAEDLPQAITEELQRGALAEQAQAQEAMQAARQKVLDALGEDALDADGNLAEQYRETKAGKEYLQAQAKAKGARSTEALQASVYNHLYTFFSRYWQDGDFISKRRYSKKERYAIPYNGEEVYLYWANHDQYYIKSGEHLTDYSYRAPNGVTVHFKLQQADVEQNNVKGQRRFFLPVLDGIAWDETARTLIIPFHYRPLTEQETIIYGQKNQQEAIIAKAVADILKRVKTAEALAALSAERRRTEKGESVSWLEHHLRQYTRRNTSDFFIHKDLKGFLSRELDFYLKNEVLNLQEMEAAGEHLCEGWFQLLRLIKRIGLRIIDFLAQIEDFQKMLWEKKKFVAETFYVITVGNIPEDFYPDIAACEAQWGQWREVLALETPTGTEKRVETLKANPTLPLDTRCFAPDFTDRLLASFDNLDDVTDGLLVHSENWQALNVLQEKYRERVKCIYIDPPYNTGGDGFLYRDTYRHSSWLAMMENRLQLSRGFMKPDASIFVSIDDHESPHLRKIVDILWEPIGFFVWEKKKKGSHLSPTFRDLTEYVFAYAVDVSKLGRLYGEAAYSDESQRLINRTNSPRVLCFPGNRIIEASDNLAHYNPGLYGEGEMAIELLDPIDVRDGFVLNPFKMRARFKWTQETLDRELELGSKIKLSKNLRPNVLRADQGEKTKTPPSLISKEIAAYEDAFQELSNLFGQAGVYGYPKPTELIRFLINAITYFGQDGIILDFFAGSGTTGHAVINLNREDGGRRKFILVEMAHYFDTVLLPRIKKVTFTPEWKDGKPKPMATAEEAERSPRIVKVIRLESYEDALNNLSFDDASGQKALELFGDDYLLRYMLRWETRHSETLLAVEKLQAPFAYKLRLHRDGETRERAVDLPETFNYLLGLDVQTRKVLNDKGRRYLVYRGTLRNGRTVSVIWRETQGWTKEDYQRDRGFVAEHKLADGADEVFVNGDSFIPGAQALDGLFKERMFAGAEV